MKAKMTTTRKWTPTNKEVQFEKALLNNGFAILGYKEYCGHTDFVLEKDGTEIEYRFSNEHDVPVADCIKAVIQYYNIKKEYETLKKIAEEKGV